MALTNITNVLNLDVYNHDKTKKSTKAIAYDKSVRYIGARIFDNNEEYEVADDSDVTLCVIRPDNVGVIVEGSVQSFDRDSGAVGSVSGVIAELTQAALCLKGTIRAQFKIENGDQILRTEVFVINNGEALDASTDDWSGEYEGIPLDELMVRLDRVNACLAPAYDATSTYDIGDMVTYESILYKCNTAIATPEAWTEAHWTETEVMTEAASVAVTYAQALAALNET